MNNSAVKKISKDMYSTKQWASIIIASLLMFGTKFITPPAGLNQSGIQVLGILAGGLILWLSISTNWPSLYVLFALMTVPALNVKSVIAGSFGNDTAVFLLFCFMLAACLTKSGFARRIAIWFLTNKLARKSPWYTVAMYLASCFLLNSFLSSSAGMLVTLPILSEILTEVGCKKNSGEAITAMMMLGTVMMGQIANGTNPISHAMSILGMSTYTSYTKETMDFFTYCAVLTPVGIVVAVAWFFVAKYLWRPDISKFNNMDFDKLAVSCGPLTKKEKISASFYLLSIILWVLPGLTKYFAPSINPIFAVVNQCFPPLVAVFLMNLIRVDGEKVLDYQDALKNVNWNMFVFIATIAMLGSSMSNADVGISEWTATVFAPLVANVSPLAFLIIMIAFLVIITNFANNACCIAIGYAIFMPLTLTIYEGTINPLVVGILLTNACQYAYATPPATPSAAVAAESGWLDTPTMFKWGMIMALITIVIVCLLGIPLANALS